MRIIYIKETENLDNTLKNKIILKLRRVFNIIKIEKVNEQVIYILPILKQKKISEYRVKKLVNKAIKLLENDASSTIALSKYLNSNTLFKNYLYSNNINILDGRFLFKCLINKIIKYIFEIKNKELNSGEVSLLINDFTDINIMNLE